MESLRTCLAKISKVIQAWETRGFEGQEYFKKSIQAFVHYPGYSLTNKD